MLTTPLDQFQFLSKIKKITVHNIFSHTPTWWMIFMGARSLMKTLYLSIIYICQPDKVIISDTNVGV